MEDADGKIWMGGEGLAFFDPLTKSKSFCTMNTEDAEGIPGKIRALFKDKNGIYWFGTERGIAKYDPKLYSFKTVKPNYPYTLQTANTILEDKEHKFWVGNYTGLGSMDRILIRAFIQMKTKSWAQAKSILFFHPYWIKMAPCGLAP